MKDEFHLEFVEEKSIFGVDIYKYSDYPEEVQVYVPILFNSLYDLTARMCYQHETFFFEPYAKNIADFKKNFISTGDGGFQIFDNPIQSIIFAALFELNVRRFNSASYISNLNTNLYQIIGRIELRYCLTNDKIFSYDNNFFGAGIINNARILAKDSLNRLLIDHNTLRWFEHHVNTIENLAILELQNFSKLSFFKENDSQLSSRIFSFEDSPNITSVDILKIGTIKSKNTSLEIYNLKIQLLLKFDPGKGKFKKDFEKFLFTIGNINTKGIE